MMKFKELTKRLKRARKCAIAYYFLCKSVQIVELKDLDQLSLSVTLDDAIQKKAEGYILLEFEQTARELIGNATNTAEEITLLVAYSNITLAYLNSLTGVQLAVKMANARSPRKVVI